MLSRLKSYLHNRKLRNLAGSNFHKASDNHFRAVRTVGCVFDAEVKEAYDKIEAFAKTLRKSGKEVDILGYFNTRNLPDVSSFRYFSIENLSLAQIPSKSEIANQFISKQFDVLINFSNTPYPPVNYLCAASNALFKIGPSSAAIDHYDLLIDLPGGFDVDGYINEIRRTLNLMI